MFELSFSSRGIVNSFPTMEGFLYYQIVTTMILSKCFLLISSHPLSFVACKSISSVAIKKPCVEKATPKTSKKPIKTFQQVLSGGF